MKRFVQTLVAVRQSCSQPPHSRTIGCVQRELINNTKVTHRFAFDGLFGMDCRQGDVFDTVAKQAVDNALNGYNATIFAYGQVRPTE